MNQRQSLYGVCQHVDYELRLYANWVTVVTAMSQFTIDQLCRETTSRHCLTNSAPAQREGHGDGRNATTKATSDASGRVSATFSCPEITNSIHAGCGVTTIQPTKPQHQYIAERCSISGASGSFASPTTLGIFSGPFILTFPPHHRVNFFS